MRLFRLLSIALLLSIPCLGQQFGGNPPALKWRQVNTDTVRIIYPASWKGNARELADLAAKLGMTQSTLGDRFRKISVVLQTGTTISNAYVGLGPRRSEFFLTPPQNSFELGSLYWPEQLMLHEFRHVQQYNNFNKGISRLFYILAGELGLTFINSTAIPNWFWEGDAVYQETHSSIQGRGRVPYFFNGYRSLAASGKNYSWLKLRNGSLRDYVPDHYQLGYLLTAYGRETYGDSLWRRVTDDAVRFKGLFYPFQSAIKRQTGISYRQFRKDALSFFTEPLKTREDPVAAIARNKKHFAGNEEFPQFIDDDHVVLVKSSYSEIPAFYIRDLKTGKDQFLRVKDISLDAYFSHRNGKLVYAAMGFDLRWGWNDYSELRLLDTYTGEQRSLTRRTKLFSPDINDEGSQLLAVNVAADGQSTLQLIGSDSGQTIRSLPNPHQYFYTHPKFAGNGKAVTAVRNRSGQMALLKVDLTSGEEEILLPFSANTIGFPAVSGDTLLITVSSGEQEQLFLMAGQGLFQIQPGKVNRSTGSYQPQIRGDKMVWVAFTAVGYRMMEESRSSARLEKKDPSQVLASPSDFGVRSLARGISLSAPANAEKVAASQPYHKGHRLFNFHSWLPGVTDAEYSITFISENVLNTLQSELGLVYNANERSKKMSFTGAYGALFPWIRFGGAYTLDRRATYNNNFVYWNEAELRGGVLLPFNFSGGRSFSSLRVATDYVYAKPQFKGNYKDSFDNHGYGYLNSYITFTNQIQQARQHIYPRFAQQVRMEYYNAVTYLKGQQLLFNGSWYFPGLFRNHNLVLNTAWHGRDTTGQLRFTNNFPFSRGYLERNFHRMMKLGVNYHFPLFYPDWGVGSIVYFLRVRANAFYDFTRIKDYNQSRVLVSRDLRSFGGEVFFDTKWWNQQPISFGFRYSRLQDAALQGLSPNQWEFVLPVSLIGR